MLSKCANPECSADFRYFGEGRLFEVHFDNAERLLRAGKSDVSELPALKKRPRSVEHFWLCPACSQNMTVALDRTNKVLVMPLATRKVQRAAAS